jgi:hypothetical protein
MNILDLDIENNLKTEVIVWNRFYAFLRQRVFKIAIVKIRLHE